MVSFMQYLKWNNNDFLDHCMILIKSQEEFDKVWVIKKIKMVFNLLCFPQSTMSEWNKQMLQKKD